MIKEMTLNDLAEVLKIEEEAFDNHWHKKEFEYALNENPFSKLYILKEDEELIGYIVISILYERLEIDDIAIKKEYRNQGYGQKLLDYVYEVAKENFIEVISLEVRESNNSAYSLYLKNGFEVMRRRKNYYKDGEDALEMAKGV